MKTLVLAPFRLGVIVCIPIWFVFSVIAYLGFLHPLFDAFNHFQPVWFFGLIVGLVLCILLFSHSRLRSTLFVLGMVGLLLSSFSLLGEVIRAQLQVTQTDSSSRQIKLMSRNLFGLNYDMQLVADSIALEKPDVIAFQEYYIEQSSTLHPMISSQYPYFADCTGGHRAAIAIYSKIPFALTEQSLCPETENEWDNEVARLVAKFDSGGSSWILVTTHLNWPVQISALRRGELSFGEKLAALTARKDGELAELAATMAGIEGPKLVVGDFNATPWAYQLTRFANQADMVRVTKNMPTFPARFYIRGWRETLPVLPLDHLFIGGGASIDSITPITAAGSDHLGLSATIRIPNNFELQPVEITLAAVNGGG